jgi:hypothetical protein
VHKKRKVAGSAYSENFLMRVTKRLSAHMVDFWRNPWRLAHENQLVWRSKKI